MKQRIYIVLLSLMTFIGVSTTLAKEIPPVSSKLVNDYAGVLSPGEASQLESLLVAYFDSTSTQLAVVIERSLENDDLFDYAQRLATAWGIGEKGKNNGALLYIAIDDRKVRIHVGYGLEATLTDAFTKRIIEQNIKPNFRNQQYAQGIYEAVVLMMQAASGEYTNDRASDKNDINPFTVLIIIFILIILFSRFGGGGKNRGRSFGGPMYWGGTFGSGGFSSGGGGGGFGGFGGGSFGGGGSSGSW